MRFWLSILFLASFPLLAAAANPCALPSRAPGTPIDAPHAAFEAYVVEVHAPQDSQSVFGLQRTQRALVEVSRSFHGPYSPGQQVETLTTVGAFVCGRTVESGGRVIVASESGGPFEIIKVLPKAQVTPDEPFAALAFAAGEPRRSVRRSLKNAQLRGDIDARLASQLHARARTGRREHCEITGNGNYAQVSWGKAFGGNDARHKVIFERAHGGWVEILRYKAPEPTPARNRTRRSKRTLWAGKGDSPHFLEMGTVPFSSCPADAWAATTS
ncbi:MAG TPA: hypothetical protein VFU13_14190 [Steroidobacteraceae bacterium]|nr:hypothetical protein [Steroidobacteraceae bacterium]